jgi:hypothetical protein
MLCLLANTLALSALWLAHIDGAPQARMHPGESFKSIGSIDTNNVVELVKILKTFACTRYRKKIRFFTDLSKYRFKSEDISLFCKNIYLFFRMICFIFLVN